MRRFNAMKKKRKTRVLVYMTDDQKKQLKKKAERYPLSQYLLIKGLDMKGSTQVSLFDREALLLLGEMKVFLVELLERDDNYLETDRAKVLENLNDVVKEIKEIGQKIIDISC